MGLEIRHIKQDFIINNSKIEVLKDVNLDIKDQEIICIVGPSGCGKSTLLKIIIGLNHATGGEIILDGKKLTKPTAKEVGIIFQEPRLFPWSTVEKNVGFGISEKLDKERRKRRIQHHIELVGLEGFEKALPGQLSGGMQQRVSIARSLINRPRVLLLDEPFGALDAFTKISMQQELLRIWEKEKMTIIMVTHDIDEAIFLADRVVVMSGNLGEVKKIVPIEISRERDRTSDNFTYYRNEIFKQFYESSQPEVEYNI
jgi:sulfonate transport system ATP-binding protein